MDITIQVCCDKYITVPFFHHLLSQHPLPPQKKFVYVFSHLTIAYSQAMMVPSGNWTTKGTMLPVMG